MNNILLKTPTYKLNEEINSNKIYVKREDLIPFSFGGNKVRKAILFFKEIEKGNYDHVVTYGSSSSNHCRVISNLANVYNIPCTIISLSGEDKTFNSRLVENFGSNVILTKVENVKRTIDSTLEKLTNKGFKPYFIQGGGHGNLGTKAYVEAYEEITHFEKMNDMTFDYIFFATGTGSTHAGLVCGSILNKDNKSIIGISIGRKMNIGKKVVENSVVEYLESIEHSINLNKEIIFNDNYLLEGYGSYNDEISTLISNVMKKEGIPLDYTYTGKAFWGMQNYIKEKNIKEKNILFIHTGGTPLFFSDMKG